MTFKRDRCPVLCVYTVCKGHYHRLPNYLLRLGVSRWLPDTVGIGVTLNSGVVNCNFLVTAARFGFGVVHKEPPPDAPSLPSTIAPPPMDPHPAPPPTLPSLRSRLLSDSNSMPSLPLMLLRAIALSNVHTSR